eukprot:1303670-Rhodomonas_salina.2
MCSTTNEPGAKGCNSIHEANSPVTTPQAPQWEDSGYYHGFNSLNIPRGRAAIDEGGQPSHAHGPVVRAVLYGRRVPVEGVTEIAILRPGKTQLLSSGQKKKELLSSWDASRVGPDASGLGTVRVTNFDG